MKRRKKPSQDSEEVAVRRGPRFTDETTSETVQRMREAAVRLVNEKGFGALNFRTLAEELDVTRTAPLYYFGTTVGLIAAIAAYGLDELTSQLRRVRESGGDSLPRLALAYGKFALMNPNLYRAMHSPELWWATTDDETGARRANQGAAEKAETWIQRAADLRRDAFREFELAVEDAIAGGLAKEEPRGQKGASAHLLTTIVDGFLFHHFEERVGAGRSMKGLLADLEFLLDRALTGLYLTSSSKL
jgi:AcrR family transcriptional regulator